MVEFIKKNKKIILSSSIFTGISSNNIYCGCCGDTNNNQNKNNNTNNPTQKSQQNPTKDEKPQQDPHKDETEKNNIISECENLIVEIKKLNKDYPKTVNKGDTIENLKNFKNELQTDLNTLKNTKPGENPEKNEKENLIEEIKKITEDGIKNAAEKDKKMIKYLYFNNIDKTDDELINIMNNKLNLSSRDIDNLKNAKNNCPSYFENRQYENEFIQKKISKFDFSFKYSNKNYNLWNTLNISSEKYRVTFFKLEKEKEEDIKDADKIIIKEYVHKDDSSDVNGKLCFSLFNGNICQKIAEIYSGWVLDLKNGLFFLGCELVSGEIKPGSFFKYKIEDFKFNIKEDLSLEIELQ